LNLQFKINYNYSENLYSVTYSAGRQCFTGRKAKIKIQYKIQSKNKRWSVTVELVLIYGQFLHFLFIYAKIRV